MKIKRFNDTRRHGPRTARRRSLARGLRRRCAPRRLPSVFPDALPALNGVKVDTDPENMLSRDEAVRVFHNDMKKVFALNEMVVLGVVNESHPDGVFNPESLRKIYELTEYAQKLRGEAIGQTDPQAGVIRAGRHRPVNGRQYRAGRPGRREVRVAHARAPATESDAIAVRDKARRIPFLDGTLLSESGGALCLYLPLTSKDLSYNVYSSLRDRIATFEGDERYFITGLPVANDTFGHEMFVQMAISAPTAMVVIFLLMLFFFRKLTLIISPMLVALASVILTMGTLVITGNTIHS